MVDVTLVAILALMIGFVFFLYLLLRRTLTEFKQGVERGEGKG
jgi:hypothetical protein